MLEENAIVLLERLAKGTSWLEAVVNFLFDLRGMGVEIWRNNEVIFEQGIAIGSNQPWNSKIYSFRW